MKKILLITLIIPFLNFGQELNYSAPKVFEKKQFKPNEIEGAELFAVVEDPPIFYNCNTSASRQEKQQCFQQGVMQHISSNFKYPAISKEMGVSERIIVNFHISKKGKIENVQVVRGQDKHLKAEAIRLVSSIPDLIPAKQRGQAVSCSFTVPISFQLSNNTKPNKLEIYDWNPDGSVKKKYLKKVN